MFITIPSVPWANSCPSVSPCSAVGKDCWGWLAHTSGCSEPEGSWPLLWVMRNQWLRAAGGRGLFSTPCSSRRVQLWHTLQPFGLEKGRERESISLRVWQWATGWMQSGWGWPSDEGAKWLCHWEEVARYQSLSSCGESIQSPFTQLQHPSDGHKSQDVSLSFIAFHNHKLESLSFIV